MASNEHWTTKFTELISVTSVEIEEEIERINATDEMFVFSTQLFPIIEKGSIAYKADKPLYNVLVWYKISPKAMKQIEAMKQLNLNSLNG